MISCPDDLFSNNPVSYPAPGTSDPKDTQIDVSCDPPVGSTIEEGTTEVTCEAMDDAGNTANCTFMVTLGKIQMSGWSRAHSMSMYTTKQEL